MSLMKHLLIISFFLYCSNANATSIEVTNDHIEMTSKVWFDGYPGSSQDTYSGHFFGNYIDLYSEFTIESPDPTDFYSYGVWARATHWSTDCFWLTMGADYCQMDLSIRGTAIADFVLTYEFSVIGTGGSLEITGAGDNSASYSLSLFDNTLGMVVTDGMGIAGIGFFDLIDSHTYRLDYNVSMLAHGDPDPGPWRWFNFWDVDNVTYVPEPSSMLIFCGGIIGLAGIRLRRKKLLTK